MRNLYLVSTLTWILWRAFLICCLQDDFNCCVDVSFQLCMPFKVNICQLYSWPSQFHIRSFLEDRVGEDRSVFDVYVSVNVWFTWRSRVIYSEWCVVLYNSALSLQKGNHGLLFKSFHLNCVETHIYLTWLLVYKKVGRCFSKTGLLVIDMSKMYFAIGNS